MIIVYGSNEIPVGLIDAGVEAIKLDCEVQHVPTNSIMYDRDYYVININNLPEDDMLTTAHYLYHYAKTLDHSPEGEIAGNYLTGCVNREHLEKKIECHCGLDDCKVVDIGCYKRTLANGVEVYAYYIS